MKNSIKSRQQIWNEKNREKIKQYQTKSEQNCKKISVRLHKERDRRLIEGLTNLDESISDFLKAAIEEKLIKENIIEQV